MRRHRTSRAAVAVAALALLAACSGGGDITGDGSSDTTAPSSGGGDTTTPGTGETTTTIAPDSLPDCPTDALASATGTVELTFWHGMSGALGDSLQELADAYNTSQSKVHVSLVQGSYEETADNYFQASTENRPDLVQLPEYQVQAMVDTASAIPVGACIESSGYDTSSFLTSGLSAYATGGVQWAMPFNISNPVLFYNEKAFAAAGLDPAKPPTSLDELREFSQKIVDAGGAKYGLALDSGFDSGGGWYVEQWFAKAGVFYADADNGRSGRATKVLYNDTTGVELLTFLQGMIDDGLAVNVGDNSQSGYDNLLKLADDKEPAAMTIATSASLGPVLQVLASGQFPNVNADDVGVGPMPGPDGKPGALIGGAALWVVNHDDPVRAAAAWDFLTYLEAAQQQSTWAVATGYVPVRSDALDLEPYKTTVADDPRFAVAYQQLLDTPDAPTSAGPVLGPLREVRTVLASAVADIFGGADVKSTLDAAAQQSNGLISDYNARN